MKNKKNIYILLPVVLLIWGSLIYRFFSFSSPQEIEVPVQEFKVKPLVFKQRDTTPINVNYRDPFLGISYAPQSQSVNKTKAKAKKVVKEKEPVLWPTIVYKGIVSDTKDKIKVFMLIINGKTCLMKKGNTEEEVFLKQGDRNAVYVKYKGNLNIILLQE